MSRVNVSSEINIKITTEEMEILKSARKIVDSISSDLWQSDNNDAEDLACMFCNIAEDLKRVIEGDY